jgi:hypothetical protein
MYVCICVRTYVCMYVYMYASSFGEIHLIVTLFFSFRKRQLEQCWNMAIEFRVEIYSKN